MKFSFDEVVLGTVANFSYGYTETALNHGDIRFIRITDIDERGNLKEANARYINISDGIDKYTVKKGDLLVARTGGTFGKTLYYNSDILSVYASFLIKIDVDNRFLLPEFYFHFSQSNKYWFQAKNLVTGGGQPQFNANVLKEIVVPLPPLLEQKAIANLLSIWDEVIERTERLNQVKEKRFKGYVQRLIDQRCTEWRHIKPKKILNTITEKNFPDEELLSVTQNRGVIPRSMLEGRVMSPNGTTASYKLIKSGDFVISLRSFQGGVEYSNYQGIISPAYTVLRPKIDINTEFYRHFFKTYIFIEKYLNLAVIGIRDGKQISIPDFMSIKIPVPPLEEQKQIAETLSTAQQEIDLLKQLTEKYKTQKRGLMQKLLTGEWRIKPEILNKYKEAQLW